MNALRRSSRHGWLCLGLCLATVLFTGCTPFTNFYQQCNYYSRASSDMTGCWKGYWRSEKSGHKGCLDAVIKRCDDCHYSVRFHATFFKFFSFEYTMVMNVVEQGGEFDFAGQKDLGKIAGGIYYCRGHATQTCFNARYHSCKDHGVFVMTRQTCCCPQ